MDRRPIVTMVIAGTALAAALIAAVLSIPWFPPVASKQGHETQTLFRVLLIVSMPIFALVVTVVVTAVIRFRMRPGQEDQDGPPIHGNTGLETLWTAVPALLLVSLCVYSFIVLRDLDRAPAHAAQREMTVDVTGRQFAWSFTYPPSVTHGKPLTTPELWLPEGHAVRFNIHTMDVIHDFWVPNFAVKEDAVPGITTHYRITPDRRGTFPVVCNELCGIGHAFMRSAVHVVTPARFKAWLASQTQAT
jgi:cytochrome c oxidase subunit 2